MDVVKRYLLIALFLISGCSKKELESVNETSLIEKNGVYYTKDKQPYSGQVSSLYDNGSIKSEWTLKNGRLDGLYNLWYKSGKKWFQKNYKDGELDGLSIFWDREEFLDTEKTYKDGELILQRCFDVDGNECECSDLGRGCK